MPNVKYRIVAASFLLATLAIAGCASNAMPDEETMVRPSCPRNQKMQCEKRSGRPARCRCVAPGEMEQMIEELTNLEIH